MFQHRFNRRQPRGFTLLEVFALVGIVAVLIGILLPAVSRAREQGRRARCLANLQQLGQAMVLYARAHHDRLPNLNPKGSSDDYDGMNAAIVVLNRDYVKSPKLFHCPSDRDPVPADIVTGDMTLPDSGRVSYDFYSIYFAPEYGPKVMAIKDAPLAWDIEGGRTTPTSRQNHGTHGGNVVFADGRAEWQPLDDWDGKNWPHPAARHYLPW